MPIQSALNVIGVAKQTAFNTPAAQPTFVHGITGGGVSKVEVEQDRASVTSGYRVSPHAERTAVRGSFDFTTKAFPKSVGLWLYAALGGKAVTGAGPYTHTFTPAAALPYLTVWGSLDGTIVKLQDCMVDELECTWAETAPPEIRVSGLGGAITYNTASITPGTDESTDKYLLSAGGTFRYDVDSATPAAGQISAGSFKVANGVTAPLLSGSLTPSKPFPGRQDVDTGLTVIPDDLADWRTVVTGTAAGTTPNSEPVYGSQDATFPFETASLKLETLRVANNISFPDGDPGGGPVELEVAGVAVMPAGGGAAITATLINSQATY